MAFRGDKATPLSYVGTIQACATGVETRQAHLRVPTRPQTTPNSSRLGAGESMRDAACNPEAAIATRSPLGSAARVTAAARSGSTPSWRPPGAASAGPSASPAVAHAGHGVTSSSTAARAGNGGPHSATQSRNPGPFAYGRARLPEAGPQRSASASPDSDAFSPRQGYKAGSRGGHRYKADYGPDSAGTSPDRATSPGAGSGRDRRQAMGAQRVRLQHRKHPGAGHALTSTDTWGTSHPLSW